MSTVEPSRAGSWLPRIPGVYVGLLPWGLILLLAIAIVSLAMKHRATKREFQEHRRSDLRVQAGTFLPPFSASSTSGTTFDVASGSPDRPRQLLIMLTAECPYCARTLPAWKSLYSEFARSGSLGNSFLALTTDSMRVARSYAESSSLPFPLVPFASRKYAQLFRASLVPQTLVVDGSGRVVFARSGELSTQASIDSVRVAFTGEQ